MIKLENDHGTYRLMKSEKPFFIRGGEVGNSSASCRQYMEEIWPHLSAMNVNTVLTPVYWESMEPEEGRFDFTQVDYLIQGARAHRLHLVLLWFGSWKNSMSCYVPAWIKEDSRTYPRARRRDGGPMEILSAFSSRNLKADARAFAALMAHLKKTDADEETVLMVQVENEVAMVDQARDYGPEAGEAYNAPVPAELLNHLPSLKENLRPQPDSPHPENLRPSPTLMWK